MVVDETALILVFPEDTTELVLLKMVQSGVSRVQLLVPEGVTSLHDAAQTDRLRQMAEDSGIDLVLISSDQATIAAARQSRLQTMLVQGAQVVAPKVAAPPAAGPLPKVADSPFATRVLERGPRDIATDRLAADLNAGDAAFLDALDDLDAPPRASTAASVDDEELFAALEGLSSALDERPVGRVGATTADDDFLDSLDSIGADEDELRRPVTNSALPPAAPRIRPEDIELSADEKARAGQTGRRTASAPAARGGRDAATQPIPARRVTGDASAARMAELDPPPAAPRRPWLIPAIALGLLLLLLAIGAVLLLGGGATVSVGAPLRSDAIQPVTDMPIPVAAPGGATGGTAVEGETIASDVAFSAQGEVAESTLSPAGTARGVISILNQNQQPFLLPAGTEFVAVKTDGQEVPFVSSAEVLVPAATTSDQGAQIVTTRGQVSLEVAARSPGSASNVDANSIRRVTPPGGQSFNVDTGLLLVRHDPLFGGSEEEVRIVKEDDVQRLLGEALAGLDTQALQQLEGLGTTRKLNLEPTTITPRRADLEQLQGFELNVSPAVGQTVDPANPRFSVTVQARYSGLATPDGKPLEAQLGSAFAEQLRQAGMLQSGDCKAPTITGWRWDGSLLAVSGQIGPNTKTPACGGGLDDAAKQTVREAVRGKSRSEAEAALQALVQRGLIGSYTLPDVERLPSWDWQLRVATQ